ncbi:MAG TPA: chromate efflux transporter [Verrucomicrobiota bacterium]|nr:chromate transporter [Verrucomicrobiales bacterium]HRI11777.1 chromate efflux transporter [Verrucomicrobiota bacterium]
MRSGLTREAPDPARRGRLRELAGLFFKLGSTAFGGPAAHIAMMEDEVVRRRQWLTREEFLDLLSASNLIPGPNSTELAIHIGHRRAGWLGLLVAGTCFILPAAFLVTAIAWAYVRFGSLPQVEGLLYGIKPVIIAVVIQALWNLGRTAIKTKLLAAMGICAAVLNFTGLNELILLLAGGLLMIVIRELPRGTTNSTASLAPLIGATSALNSVTSATAAATISAPFALGKLFWFFVKVGSVLFGSGYVLLAFLRADLVERWHWLNESQLLDAIAVGQLTPGPVFTTATFIGYLLAGPAGAAVATIGIFLPAFVFVALSGPLVPRLRKSPTAGAFLDGVNVVSLALMAVVTWRLGVGALIDLTTVLIALVAAVALVRYRINSAWLVIAGGLIGLAVGHG